MTERLFGVQRHERLLGELRRSGSVRVADLARELGGSELTIRRDIAALAERHLVTRVHGGATRVGRAPAAGVRGGAPPPNEGGAPGPRGAGRPGTRFTIGIVVPSLD